MDPYPRSPSPDGPTLKFLRGIEPPKKFHSISEILKPTSSEDPPSFLLEEAKFYMQGDPTTPVNILLEAKSSTKLVVEGYFVADRDQLNLLKKDGSGNHKNNTLVRVYNVAAYSVGDDPVTIWVASDNIWLEVRPHVDFLRKYLESTLAVKIYYGAVDFYKKMETLKNLQIHLMNLSRSFTSKKFFHDMMQGEHGGQSNIFFKWIAAGAPLSHIDGLPISGSSHHFSPVLTETERHELNSKYQEITNPYIPPPVVRPSPPPAPVIDITSNRLAPNNNACDWKSTRFPQGITPDDRFPISSFGLLCLTILTHCAETGKRSIPDHTIGYLHDRLYYGFGITSRPVAREVIRCCPEEIITALGDAWADSPLVKDLENGVPSQMGNDSKHVVELQRIMSGEKMIAMRNSKAAAAPKTSVAATAPRIARFARSSTPTSASSPAGNTAPVVVAARRSEPVARNTSNRSMDVILTPRDETAVKSSGYGKLAFEPFGL